MFKKNKKEKKSGRKKWLLLLLIPVVLFGIWLSIPVEETPDIQTPAEKNPWTIMVYLCGSDLESAYGMATWDMEEMIDSSARENIRFVVQTGGAYDWTYWQVYEDKTQRFVIQNGECTRVYNGESQSMGDGAALADFVRWSMEFFPAENTGLVMWDHGGGSITGVCFDEIQDYDSLSLGEIDGALSDSLKNTGEKLTFVGFDACLMGNVESAAMLADYSQFMYASEELEPGYGWDYTSIGNFLQENPTADGAQLGQIVCDSYYASCEEIECESYATFSIIDLSKMDRLMTTFNGYARELYKNVEKMNVFSELGRQMETVDNFGGNNKSEGYTNMVDMAGFVTAGSRYAAGSERVLQALDAAVIYMKNGADHIKACGLSMYYPLELQGSQELQTFGGISISPYYLALVDKMAYGATNNGVISDYSYENVFSLWEEYQGLQGLDEWYYAENENDYWEYFDSFELTGESTFITFDSRPSINANDRYSFRLSQDGLGYATSVQAGMMVYSEDETKLLDLGLTGSVIMDWESGVCEDGFDGCWFTLPDGQILAVYLVSEHTGFDIYTSPVLINGQRTNLRIIDAYIDGQVFISGTWNGIDEYGFAGRIMDSPRAGDEITPLYSVMNMTDEENEERFVPGQAYIYDGQSEPVYGYLPYGKYLYSFLIDDVFGDYYLTDYVIFNYNNGVVDVHQYY